MIDFTKAFYTVNHNLLLKQLSSYFGFGPTAVKLVRFYLDKGCQSVKVGCSFSGFRRVTSDVPKGFIFGTILLSIFITDLVTCCPKIYIYADDAQIHLFRPRRLGWHLIQRINDDLCHISHWSFVNNLQLNSDKTKVIVISSNVYDFDSLPNIIMGD